MNSQIARWLVIASVSVLVGCGGGGRTPATFTVGGTVSGLSGSLVLQNNGGDDLTISADGRFTFSAVLRSGSPYAVGVKTQPQGQTCVVSGGAGTVTGLVMNVTVSCSANEPGTFAVGGSVNGLSGTLVLQNNGADNLTFTADGPFAFASRIASGGEYHVLVSSKPAAQSCVVNNGNGTISDADIKNVTVNCSTGVPITVQADAGVHSVQLTWNDTGAASFNVYVSTQRGCDIGNISGCPGGRLLQNVAATSQTVTELRNGQPYFFQVEGLHAGGARGISNEAGARPNALAFDTSVRAIAPSNDGSGIVYLGGNFSDVGITAGSAAPLDPATGRPAIPDFPMVDGTVRAVISDGAGGWYLGGRFTVVGNVARSCLAHIRAHAEVDTDWNPPCEGEVSALVSAEGVVYAGGLGILATDTGGGTQHRTLIAFHDAASDDHTGKVVETWNPTFAPGAVPIAAVNAIAVSNGLVYAGGFFFDANNVGHPHLAAFDAVETRDHTGRVVAAWQPRFAAMPNTLVLTLSVSNDVVYAGGVFTALDNADVPHRGLAAFEAADTGDHSGAVVASWNPNLADVANAAPRVFALHAANGLLYAGGSFTAVDAADTQHRDLAAFDAVESGDHTGKLVAAWNPEVEGGVISIATMNGIVYAGGAFTRAGADEVTHRYLAAFEAADSGEGTGEVIAGWSPRVNDDTLTIAVADGVVYAGGSFTGTGSVVRNSLAAIDRDGTLQDWSPDPGNVFVAALAVAGTTVYAAGQQRDPDRGYLAAFDRTSGAAIPTWNSVPDRHVRALAISADQTTVYAGGDFFSIDNSPPGGASVTTARNHLAAFTAAGDGGGTGMPTPWDPNADNVVSALVVSGSTVYAGGPISLVGGGNSPNPRFSRNNLVAFDGSGTGVATAWNPNPNGQVLSLATSPDGATLYAGGFFSTVGSNTIPGAPPLTPRGEIAALSAVGNGAATTWNPSPLSPTPLALVASDTQVYAFGNFSAAGLSLLSLSALTGEAVPAWDAVRPNSGGRAVALSGTTLFVGGEFTALHGTIHS